jgi:hypothetical protein
VLTRGFGKIKLTSFSNTKVAPEKLRFGHIRDRKLTSTGFNPPPGIHCFRQRVRTRKRWISQRTPGSFLIAAWQMIRAQSTRKVQMKTILMLIVGLMLAGCGSMESRVRNHGVASTSRPALPDRGNGIAVDTICACP